MGNRRCAVSLLPLLFAVVVIAASPASAATRGAARLNPRPLPGMLGVVPSAYSEEQAVRSGKAQAAAVRRHTYQRPKPLSSVFPRSRTAHIAAGSLLWHGGPVMHTNVTRTIYWGTTGASMTSTYESLVNGFLQNVGAASGALDNVYSIDPQYYDSAGYLQYSSSFAGSVVDSATPIPDNCSSEYAGTGITVHGCVTDADIQAEVSRVAAAQGWTPGPGTMFLVFTPKNVGSCFDSFSGTCAYSYYCAYHSNFYDGQSRDVLYSDQPHPDTSDPNGINIPGDCDSGQHPNGDIADAAINLVSHEHSETITDPNGDAWWDSAGNEIGDKCAWMFGTPLGTTGLGSYNQSIASGRYYLQQEWSNAAGGCRLGTATAGAPAIQSLSPAQGKVGTSVTISGANLGGASAVKFNGTSAAFTVVSPSTITATVPGSATTGKITVTTPAGTATSATNFSVLPAISSFTPTQGRAGTTVTITGTGLLGTRSVKFNGTSAGYRVLSSTSVRTSVPSGASSGPISLTTAGGTATSATAFTVTH